jgi:hypothetical protein
MRRVTSRRAMRVPVGVVGVVAVLLAAGCTGGSRQPAPASAPTGCPVASAGAGDGGWKRVAVLTGAAGEGAADVTGILAGSASGPWIAVGAVRSAPATTASPTTASSPSTARAPATTATATLGSTTATAATTTGSTSATTTSAGAGSSDAAPLKPAVWTSNDGSTWTRSQVEPVTLDGAVDRLLGVAREGTLAASVGVAFSHNEGVARPSAWASAAGGPWREAVANRELFGGPAGLGVSDVAAGPLGLAVFGLRTGSDNRTFVAVWRSGDGRRWLAPLEDPALTSGRAEALGVLGGAVGRNAIVIGGHVTHVTDPSDGVIWSGVDQGGGRLRWQRVDPGPAGLGGAGAQEVDRMVAVGSGFVAAGLSGEPGSLRLASWTSPDGAAWRRSAVSGPAGIRALNSLASTPDGLLAAGVSGAVAAPPGAPAQGASGGTPGAGTAGSTTAAGGLPATACLWRSGDGQAWTAVPLPAALARSGRPLRVLAGQDDTRILLVVQGASGAEIWAGVPADVGKASS